MRKTHQDRIALIDRLEKKYSLKVQLHRQSKQERSVKQLLRTMRGNHLMRPTEDYLQYEVSDVVLHNGRRLAF